MHCHNFFCFRIAKISHTGRIEVGKRADLLLFDDNLSLLRTVVYGKVVFKQTKLDADKKLTASNLSI